MKRYVCFFLLLRSISSTVFVSPRQFRAWKHGSSFGQLYLPPIFFLAAKFPFNPVLDGPAFRFLDIFWLGTSPLLFASGFFVFPFHQRPSLYLEAAEVCFV